MKASFSSASILLPTFLLLLVPACTNPDHMGVTNQQQPGPVIGRAVGLGVGSVVGNVAGAGVGLGEGIAVGATKPFDNTTRIVRSWRTETTTDGRSIKVPVEIMVDRDGRPLSIVK